MACSPLMSPLHDRILGVLLATGALSGCNVHPISASPPTLSQEAVATRDAPTERVFRGQRAGAPVHLLVHDCEVFQVESRAGGCCATGGTYRAVDGRNWKKL